MDMPIAFCQTDRQRLACATACRSIAFGDSYGLSTGSRRAAGLSLLPDWRRAGVIELCLAISSCARADSASASSGNSVDSAFASRARICRGSAPSASLPAARPGAAHARQSTHPFPHGHVLRQVPRLDRDPQRFPFRGGAQDSASLPHQHLGAEHRHLRRPASSTIAEGVAAHLVRDHVSGLPGVRAAQFRADVPAAPPAPPCRRAAVTDRRRKPRSPGSRPASSRATAPPPAGRVPADNALVTPADRIHRRVHCRHRRAPAATKSVPAWRRARAPPPRGAAPLALLVLLLPPVTARFPLGANLVNSGLGDRIPPDAAVRDGHAEDAQINSGAPRWGCFRCVLE